MDPEAHKAHLRKLQRRFDRAAGRFDQADFVYRKTLASLLERLAPLRVAPQVVVDLGAATGTGSRAIAKHFRRARILSVDISSAMLRAGRAQRGFLSRVREIQGEASALPLPSGSVDVVIANMLLPWLGSPAGCLAEIARVLKKGGVFAFATLGPESLGAGAQFTDMHDVGDALVRAGLADPVLDMDRLAITYDNADGLLHDLVAAGVPLGPGEGRAALTGTDRYRAFLEDRFGDTGGGGLTLGLELVFGHAWGTGPRLPGGEIRIDPAAIGRTRQR